MNVSYAWLRELVDTDLTPDAMADMLTNAGCTVEEMETVKDDTILVAEVTTNRPDWLCHLGVAHEIAALTGKSVKPLSPSLQETGPAVETLTSVTVEKAATEFCPRYTARVIQGITVKESPAWLKKRLEAIGQRSINNIVDITNLVCFEMNQPLHAFDYDLLAENRIVVRMAKPAETFKAITGEEDKLTENMLVIADAEKAVALAGVKGGSNSEVHAGTVNVLLESAWFQQQQVRRTSRATKMASESSYRFERGIDPGMTERASARAAELILELAGGTLAKGVIDTNPDLAKPWDVSMRFARCDQLLGVHIEPIEIEEIFRGLGLKIVKRDAVEIMVTVPTFRQDLTREADLIEEVIRVAGYSRIPDAIHMPLMRSHEPAPVSGARTARKTLVGLGFHECFTDSFVAEAWEQTFHPWSAEEPVRILNPVNHERPLMRTSLIPSLLDVRRVNRLETDVQLFEINHVYFGGADQGERTQIALLDDRGLEYVRGAFEGLLSALRIDDAFQLCISDAKISSGFAEGSAAEFQLNGKTVARMGLISNEQVQLHDLSFAPAVLEADFSALVALPRKNRVFQSLPKFPAVRRDIALVVLESVLWQEIETRVRETAEHMETIQFESLYRGKGIESGQKSMAFSMTFRRPDRSLTDEEANGLRDTVVSHLLASISNATVR